MHEETSKKKDIIFISGRFRSGTSMLWNIFNQLPQYCAWYEPLHPNLLSHIKHVKPKEDHMGIDDYWQNYSKLTGIQNYYSSQFGQKNIYLEKHNQWPELKNYIQYLIDNSGDEIPVLQFNRIDLRLSWIKNNFPDAKIIHIQRESFGLWKSSRKHIKTDINQENESFPDAYDLLQWSVDLAKNFPMLQAQENRNGYYRHYFIWKLSTMLAKVNCDINLNLEGDFFNSRNGIKILSNHFKWDKQSNNKAAELVKIPSSANQVLKKEQQYKEIEKLIDNEFTQLGLNKLFPSSKLSSIQHEYEKHWLQYECQTDTCVQELLNAMKDQKDELTAVVN